MKADYSQAIVSVWSSFGHQFIATGDATAPDDRDNYVSCLTCGGQYLEHNLGDGRGEYLNGQGREPMDCSGRTDLEHGIEAACQDNNGRECDASADNGTCEHTDFQCDCLLCDC